MQNVERTVFKHGPDYQFFPCVQIGAEGLLAAARRVEEQEAVLSILKRLEWTPFNEYVIRYYEEGLKHFGSTWGYADLLTVLHVASRWLQPKTYLEIGVFHGRSASMVVEETPDVHLVGFDLWLNPYEGLPGSHQDIVRKELRRIGHRGPLTLVDGDSKVTVPNWHEIETFDLVLVDGDHGEVGGPADLRNVVDRVNVGGVLVFDDVGQLIAPWLPKAWEELIEKSNAWTSAKHIETGAGVAVAVRRM